MLTWEVTTTPADADVDLVAAGVLAFGRAEAVGGNPQPVACLVRREGVVVAGGAGRTEFERLFVQSLWVSEALRGQGIGSGILMRLEQHARAAGCRSVLIETLSDRTAALYKHLGYQVIAHVPRYVGRFTRHILVKPLAR